MESQMYTYRCKIVKIVDGDTVDVDIDLGFGTWIHNERVRLNGIDAPESRTSDKVEKKFGMAAKARVQELLPVGDYFVITTKLSNEKYGRTLGNFLLGDIYTTVSSTLIEEGHAVPYHGQSKDELIELHQINRDRLIAEGKIVL